MKFAAGKLAADFSVDGDCVEVERTAVEMRAEILSIFQASPEARRRLSFWRAHFADRGTGTIRENLRR